MTHGSTFDIEQKSLSNLPWLQVAQVLRAKVVKDLVSIRTREFDDR
jgi:hypothetical protein